MTATRDATIAARVPGDLRTDLELVRDQDREPDLTHVIRKALRAYADTRLGRKNGAGDVGLLAGPRRAGATHPGARARDKAVTQAGRNADPEWFTEALTAIRRLGRGHLFTTDDIWERVGPTREPRAMGAVLRAAQREGIAKPTDSHRLSDRPQCHRRPLRVWVRDWSIAP